MANRILGFIWKKPDGEKPLHPVERRVAKRWIKARLARIFPELRDNPAALEKVYRELSMEPRQGVGKGGGTLFEVTIPEELL